MNKISNRQAICDVLVEKAKNDNEIIVVCSDSRGSASLTPFANTYPEQFVEVGIAEQNLVGISAGLASCGKKVFCASPAAFLLWCIGNDTSFNTRLCGYGVTYRHESL